MSHSTLGSLLCHPSVHHRSESEVFWYFGCCILLFKANPFYLSSTWGKSFIAAADKCLIQGQPIWKVDQADLSLSSSCTLFSQSAADITAVAFWDDTVRSKFNWLFLSLNILHSSSILTDECSDERHTSLI